MDIEIEGVAVAEQGRGGRAGVVVMVVVQAQGVVLAGGQLGVLGDVDVEVDEVPVDAAAAAPGHELLQPGVPLQLQGADALDAALVVRRPGHGRRLDDLLLFVADEMEMLVLLHAGDRGSAVRAVAGGAAASGCGSLVEVAVL